MAVAQGNHSDRHGRSGTAELAASESLRTATAKKSSTAARERRNGLLGALASSPMAMVGLAIIGMHVLMAVVGPLVAPYPFTQFNLNDTLRAPSPDFLFGTDQFGRDVFSRVLFGAQPILILATASTALGLFLGIMIGTVSGYYGGKFDELLMRLMDALMSFPSLLLAMLVLTMMGPATENVIVAIAIVFLPRVARVVRSVVLGLVTQEYVEAARLRGESGLYVMTREILPNAMGPIVVEGAIRISYAMLMGASLGFLGLGVQPPSPDWGLMVSEARNFIAIAPWLVIFPAIAISSLVIGANLFADGLAKALERNTSQGGA